MLSFQEASYFVHALMAVFMSISLQVMDSTHYWRRSRGTGQDLRTPLIPIGSINFYPHPSKFEDRLPS